MIARIHNYHAPSLSAELNSLYLGGEPPSTAENTALAAALANEDFIQSLADTGPTLDSLPFCLGT